MNMKKTTEERDHPHYNQLYTPARIQLTEEERLKSSYGEAFVSKDSSKLKIFDDEENQLKTKTLQKCFVNCYNCEGSGEYVFAETIIPHFGKVEIMSFVCDSCGYKDRKVKSNYKSKLNENEVEKIILKVKSKEDLSRQIIRSEFCSLEIPEIDFYSSQCDGVFSTIEGILQNIHSQFTNSRIFSSSSNTSTIKTQLEKLINSLIVSLDSGSSFDIILTDSSGSSLIEKLTEKDSNLVVKVVKKNKTEQKQSMNNSILKVFIDPEMICVGDRFTCLYNESWIENCRVVRIKKNSSNKVVFYWVCEDKNYSKIKECKEGWMVNLEEMKTVEGYLITSLSNKTTNDPNQYSKEDYMKILNTMAEHVTIQSGILPTNKKEITTASLEELD